MQTVINTIYNQVADSLNKESEIVKSVGDKVFDSLLKNFKKPPSLILKIRGLGYFYMRKNKLEESLSNLEKNFERTNKGNVLYYETDEYIEQRKILKSILKERSEEYLRYLSKKKIIKELRKNKQDDNS